MLLPVLSTGERRYNGGLFHDFYNNIVCAPCMPVFRYCSRSTTSPFGSWLPVQLIWEFPDKRIGDEVSIFVNRHDFFKPDSPSWKYVCIFPPGTLLSLYCSGNHCLHRCRLFLLPDTGDTFIATTRPWRREYDLDEKFCIRSTNTDDKTWYRCHVGEPGRDFTHSRFWRRFTSGLFLWPALKWYILQIHVHPTGDLPVSLLDSPVHERHNHCSVIDLFF